jgi:hypothetical protein
MRYLIIETVAVKPHLETGGEIALSLRDAGHEVTYSWLGEGLPWDDWELPRVARLMGASLTRRRREFEALITHAGIKLAESPTIALDKLKAIHAWASGFDGNLTALKDLTYEGASLGLGVASSLISYTRNSSYAPERDVSRTRACLETAGLIFERSLALIKKENPDIVITFNGRFATSKPIVEASVRLGKPILRHECGSTFEKYELFEEPLHDLKYRSRLIEKHWAAGNDPERSLVGHDFFKRRRGGDGIGWYSYTDKQKLGKIPPLREGIRRVVYFSSSEDEYASIGKELDFGPWNGQINAVKTLISLCESRDDLELIIRLHPNLAQKSRDDQAKWKDMRAKNLRIIPPEDPSDSYALAESSDLVVTFGSTIGIEAAYWGKPVAVLCFCLYTPSGAVMSPKNDVELSKILSEISSLKAPDQSLALPFGYYFLSFGRAFKYYRPVSLLNGEFLGHPLNWDTAFIRLLRQIGIGRKYSQWAAKRAAKRGAHLAGTN